MSTITDPFRLDGRRALVTGATGGLGAGMAIGLAAAGADVVCHEIDDPPAETMAKIEALGRRAAAVVGDLSDRATPLRLVDEAEAALGPLDILINNAGTIKRRAGGRAQRRGLGPRPRGEPLEPVPPLPRDREAADRAGHARSRS